MRAIYPIEDPKKYIFPYFRKKISASEQTFISKNKDIKIVGSPQQFFVKGARKD
jgi:hypothetical protein